MEVTHVRKIYEFVAKNKPRQTAKQCLVGGAWPARLLGLAWARPSLCDLHSSSCHPSPRQKVATVLSASV